MSGGVLGRDVSRRGAGDRRMANRLRLTVAVVMAVALATIVPITHSRVAPAHPRHSPCHDSCAADGLTASRCSARVSASSASTSSSRTRTAIRSGDLKPEDFEVVEQGKACSRLKPSSWCRSTAADVGNEEPPREIRGRRRSLRGRARDDVRLFAFFLDDYHVRLENSMSAREQLARFVQTQLLAPTDMIGVMYPLEATAAVHDAQPRCDHARLQEFRSRKYDYTPATSSKNATPYQPRRSKIRNQVFRGRAIKSLIVHMGPERKVARHSSS